jgi:hypothetical protein
VSAAVSRLLALLACLALVACVPAPAGRATPAPTSSIPQPSTPQPTDPESAAPIGSQSFVRPTPLPSPTFQVYEVQVGDTLTSIARDFGTTPRSIAYWNRARYPSLDPDSTDYQPGLIEVGWVLLVIPTAVVDEDELPEPTPTPAASPPPASADLS